MKVITALLLSLLSLQAHSLDVRIVPNTPLFEDFGCHRFEGNEAVRAALQLIASARLNITIATRTFENQAVSALITRKSKSVSVDLYSSNPISIIGDVNTYKVKTDSVGTSIRVDYSFTGMGDIDFAEPMHVRSSFLVCHSPENTKPYNNFENLMKSGVKIGY